MEAKTLGDLLLTKEFWIFGVAAGVFANLILMLLWKGRVLLVLGIRIGLAHRKGYLQARDDFARSMARRENVDILSFMVLNFIVNSAVALFLLMGALVFLGVALSFEGKAILLLGPISLIAVISSLTYLVSSIQKYYIAGHAMSAVLQEVLKPTTMSDSDSGAESQT